MAIHLSENVAQIMAIATVNKKYCEAIYLRVFPLWTQLGISESCCLLKPRFFKSGCQFRHVDSDVLKTLFHNEAD